MHVAVCSVAIGTDSDDQVTVSGGVIAGIVVGLAIVVVGAVVGIIAVVRHRNNLKKQPERASRKIKGLVVSPAAVSPVVVAGGDAARYHCSLRQEV